MNAPAQRSDEWFAQRVGMITASRVGAILGVSPFAKTGDVMREMVREYLGAEKEFQGNKFTEYGEKHEPDAIRALEIEVGIVVKDSPFLVHPEIEWLGASPDGVGSDGSNIEAKCPQRIKQLEEVPHYYHQMQQQMFVTGRKFTWFVQWTEDACKVDRVDADPTWWEKNGPALTDFYHLYQEFIKDPVRCEPFLAPLEVEREDEEWKRLSAELSFVRSEMKALKAKEKKLTDQFITLADGKRSRGHGVLVFPTTRKGSVDTTKMATDGIDIEAYRKEETTTWTVKVQ